MKISTKRGDWGKTSLIGGVRVPKFHQRVESYGALDEAVAAIALARANCRSAEAKAILVRVEEELFIVAAELASVNPEKRLRRRISEDDVARLEQEIEELESKCVLLNDFVIPGPYSSSASIHLARTFIRRAEREAVKLAQEESVSEIVLRYLNRLSDLLFLLALYEEEQEVVKQVVGRVQQQVVPAPPTARKEEFPMGVTLAQAKVILKAAEAKAREIGLPFVIAVVDGGGNLVALHRMDDALLASIDIAINKAYTAVALKKETAELAALAAPGGALYGIETCCNSRIVTFGGGIPLRCGDRIVGGVGVSGGTPEEDVAVARAGVVAFENFERGVND